MNCGIANPYILYVRIANPHERKSNPHERRFGNQGSAKN